MAKFKNKLGYFLTFVTTVLSGAISAQDQPEPKAAEDKVEAAKKAEGTLSAGAIAAAVAAAAAIAAVV